jgi:glycerol-3-phosphate dehydrogenase
MSQHPEFDRLSSLQRLESEEFDVVVIGGGITGAGAYVSHFLNAMTLHLAHHQNLPN